MKTIGIIAEFNPFHKGHEYFISEAKKRSGADNVVVIMSGDYVQRGEPAILNKFTRARFALFGGANVVFELPCVYATGSAHDFAFGAVSLLNRLNVIDELWFGSESADIRVFDLISDVLINEPIVYSSELKRGLKEGLTFPKARSRALVSFMTESALSAGRLSKQFSNLFAPLQDDNSPASDFSERNLEEFLCSSNNILGIEYCIALKKLGSSMIPKTLKRQGGNYNDTKLHSSFSSAAAIRKALENCALADKNTAAFENVGHSFKDILQNLPDFYKYLNIEDLPKNIICADDFSLILKYRLLIETPDTLCKYHDISPDLARRIKQNENVFKSFTQFAMLLKSKNMTYSHICRALLRIILSITLEDFQNAGQSNFIRILGLNKSRGELLNMLKKKSDVLLCAKPADLKNDQYNKELFVSNLYESIFADKYGRDFVHEYEQRLPVFK